MNLPIFGILNLFTLTRKSFKVKHLYVRTGPQNACSAEQVPMRPIDC